ncbi:MAG TPA: hypothetical protein VLH58_09680 [Candidatus Methylomirabilis sp.]|nr:hypothetical protein [Candidatus Methylomirabilis sp.]
MRRFFRTSVAGALVTLLVPGLVAAQGGVSKRDSQGPVAVTVTLIEVPATGGPVKVKVSLDTHSVALDGIKFDDVVAMGGPDGGAIAPTAVEQAKGAGHHRQAVLAFPPLPAGAREVRITVKNVGGVGERHFKWELPIGR